MPGKRIRFYEFTVKGRTEFPVDMLRYDACWPHRQEDVTTAFPGGPRRGSWDEPRTVQLVSSVKPPTPERWSSFGWNVTEVKAIT